MELKTTVVKMELKISELAKRSIKNKLSKLQGFGGLLINFVEYKSCCGAFIQISNATVVDVKNYGTKVVPVAKDKDIIAYVERASDFFETDYTLIRVDINNNKNCDLFNVHFE